jgi:protoporphyrinogen oxidase
MYVQHCHVKWAILGGGLTGITLAHMLHAAGETVTVLEKEDTYGGLCRSRSEMGFTFDVGGSHIIFSRDEEVLTFMKEVLGDNTEERHRNTKIYYKGKYVKYPFENGLYQIPEDDRFFCINEFVKTLIAVEKGEIAPPKNFREWIYYTFGRGIAETYMVPYNEKIWNYPSEKMSLHWVEGRIPRPPVEDIIKSAIGIETEGYTHQAVFSYPIHGGIEALIRALATPFEDSIVTGFPVTSIRQSEGEFIISDGTREIVADRCICTIPIQALLPCLTHVPSEVQQACGNLKYNSLACICLGLSEEVPPFSWLYIPQKEIGYFNRISFPSNYSTEVTPENQTSILVEITFNEGDEIASLNDQEMIDHVVSGLVSMNLVKNRENVVYSHVERQKFAYVVYDLDYLKNIEIVRSFCAGQNIPLVGRFAEFEYLNMDGCIRRVFEFMASLSTGEEREQ